MKKFFFLILFNLIFFSSSFSTERENELNNLFKNNINNKDPNELTLDVLKKNKNLLKTKKDLQYYLNAFELLNSLSMNKNMGNYYDNYDYLYPHLDDELLNLKISQIQQFKEFKNKVDLDKISSIELLFNFV